MKPIDKAILLICALLLIFCFFATRANAQCSIENKIDSLLPYMAEVESLCNVTAIGDGGKAYGLYQVHPIFVKDYNRIFSGTYSHNDMFCPYTARHVVKSVLMYYSVKYYKMTCRMPDANVILSIYNGGWRGWEKESVKPYLRKFN